MKKVLCTLAAVVIAFSSTSCVTTGSSGSCCGSCGGEAKTECCGSCGGEAKECCGSCGGDHKH